MEWVQLYEKSGISRHQEAAILGGLAGALPRAELLIAAKATLLLGAPTSLFFREAAGYRAAFGFGSTWDGPICAAAA
jgi:hypothetical protein